MFVDPIVCRTKFNREVDNFRQLANEYHRRGVWLVDATFPDVFITLSATNVRPAIVVFGVVINFENYDVQPPSLRFVDPFTRQPLKASQIGTGFPVITGTNPQGQQNLQTLIQAFTDERPFLCMRGVREYHDTPAHSGDSWFLYRNTGVGTLAYLVHALVKHGTDPIKMFTLNFQGQAQVNSLQYLPELVEL